MQQRGIDPQTIAEAEAWVSTFGDLGSPETSLRSDCLKPEAPLTGDRLDSRSQDARARVVESVIQRRKQYLAEEGIEVHQDSASTERFILVCNIDDSDWSTLPHDASKGFLNECDVPAWDTWLMFDESGLLYCLVPVSFVPLVEAAMDVDPMESFRWAQIGSCEIALPSKNSGTRSGCGTGLMILIPAMLIVLAAATRW